jgi:hypothetical protein
MGKTENQDAWIIGDGVDVMLSRSIRRVDRPWTNFLAYYSGLQTHSFVYQTNFGGRIVPTKRKIIPQKQDGRLLPKLSEVERDALLTKRPMQFRPMLVPDMDDWKLNKKFNKHLQNFLIKHPQDRESLWRRLQQLHNMDKNYQQHLQRHPSQRMQIFWQDLLHHERLQQDQQKLELQHQLRRSLQQKG